jgi:hypothetical protein
MTIKYENHKSQYGECIFRFNEDGTTTIIPIEESNSDYQAYLKSLEENN